MCTSPNVWVDGWANRIKVIAIMKLFPVRVAWRKG